MTTAVWTRTYPVDTLVVNPQKRLGLVGLLNVLQDIAWIHGDHLGHGFEEMIAHGRIWVLARQRVMMADWPVWGDEIEVATWVRPPTGMFVMRDYEVREGGRRIGGGTASWLVLDAVRRRPMRFSDDAMAAKACPDRALPADPAKLAVDDGLRPLAAFDVRNSDLDVNGHVNNTRYAQWILDSVPLDAQRGRVIDDYEVDFLAETGVGDRVTIEWDGTDGTRPADRLRFQGRRDGDDRVVFTARLATSSVADRPMPGLGTDPV
jgi:acyl-ACP thioesterase